MASKKKKPILELRSKIQRFHIEVTGGDPAVDGAVQIELVSVDNPKNRYYLALLSPGEGVLAINKDALAEVGLALTEDFEP